jgi:hypothetical protein
MSFVKSMEVLFSFRFYFFSVKDPVCPPYYLCGIASQIHLKKQSLMVLLGSAKKGD